ncbi:MAG: hypothetical protein J6T57_04515 [Alphaproteobacteria bacterium]|nr:hypothetical protein [Alphaproteobacteria bacterium]
MYDSIKLQLTSTMCPKGMNRDDCPVRSYVDDSNIFYMTTNECVIKPKVPYLEAREEYIAALDTIAKLCADCQNQK